MSDSIKPEGVVATDGADVGEAANSPTSRRNFLRFATAGAGAAASVAFATSAKAEAPELSPEPEAGDLSIPADFEKRKTTPLPTIAFPMTGANLFGRACLAEGVGALFCCPGNYGVINAIANHGIPSYGGRHEGTLAHAADGFTRSSGEIAVCSGTEGPGFTNMISGIAAAHAARTPLLLVASNMRMSDEDTESGIQLMYQQPLTEGIKKYGKRLVIPNRTAEYIGYAFRALKTGIPGPVHLDFPSEVAGYRFQSEADLGYYGKKALYRTESRPAPAPSDLNKAMTLIAAAKRPMVVASTGVFYSKAWDALKAFAEKSQIPVTESGPQFGRFPHSHPLSAGASGTAYASVDLVILVGQYCMPSAGEYAFPPDAKYIRIQPEAGDIGRNMPIDVGIVACEKLTLEAMTERVKKTDRSAWINEIAAARKAFYELNDDYYKLGKGFTDACHPAVIGAELSQFLYKTLPKDQTSVVLGGYGIARYMRRYMQAERPGQVVNGGYQFGPIGPDVGYAIGVGAAVQQGAGTQASVKGAPVFNVTSDASFGISGVDVETQAKYRLPVINIIYNNNAWGTWNTYANVPHALHMYLFQENIRYDKMAEALGCHGEYVQTPDQFLPAVKRAYDIAKKDGIPSVINCQGRKEFWLREDKYKPGFLGKIEPGITSYYH